MKATVVQVDGAPGPTLVLAGDHLPPGALALGEELRSVRRWLERTGRGHISKLALYGPSSSPAFDLDYRFVQSLPGGFDFRCGCGHSLLACVAAAGLAGPVRIRALTTGDTVVCEPESNGSHTVRFIGTWAADRLLPTGRPLDRICGFSVSVVSFGNPYVFVGAAQLGAHTADELFGAGVELLPALLKVRAAAARLLGLPANSALPKVAAVGVDDTGRPFARSVTVGGWHPGLAVTGAACLASAAVLPGTLPHRLSGGSAPTVLTSAGRVCTTTAVQGKLLRSIAVHGKRAHVVEQSVPLPWRIRVTA